jgi:putative heme-binding domain-containing protein
VVRRIAAVLLCGLLVRGEGPPALDDQTAIQVEALSRLKGVDLESNATLKGAIMRVLEKTHGTPSFVEIVRDFNIKGQAQALLDYALKYPNDSSGVDAFKLAAADLGQSRIEPLIATQNGATVVRLIGNSNEKELIRLLHSLIGNSSWPVELRKEALRALAQNKEGANYLLDMARKGELPADLKLLASSELNFAPWPEVKKAAAEILPLPQSQNAEPVPPITELVKRRGDAARGAEVFVRPTVGCINCHQVNGKGVDFGPALSEIGTKLGKDAIYESILDPSAGISFGYEAWSIELKNGDEIFGLIASETNDELAVKTQNGITTKYKKSEIAKRQKQTLSIMPAGLQLTMSTKDLVDLVEYLSTLKKN